MEITVYEIVENSSHAFPNHGNIWDPAEDEGSDDRTEEEAVPDRRDLEGESRPTVEKGEETDDEEPPKSIKGWESVTWP